MATAAELPFLPMGTRMKRSMKTVPINILIGWQHVVVRRRIDLEYTGLRDLGVA